MSTNGLNADKINDLSHRDSSNGVSHVHAVTHAVTHVITDCVAGGGIFTHGSLLIRTRLHGGELTENIVHNN